ncbi:methyltransferase [Cellulomonas fimi]|uniref:RNA methylase n=1 Tax=Cellulomonas fimi (strain ATCC 484 / DSM 20113 / JCM 1341 / CCUG 24087 / LMG 16345 / NBRC 15513 / NCIMB 8980 / NCTC 7547 / NRS-133) TaxID=590998 RepID=F4H6A6_CELFA|nr:methyltransferase [Cellulomonas fimi]AEE44418.1 RNA methylase [Cellulomonas fimi ATCC 484]VEH26322.1 23S rRNA m(2)G2445 methyltransferase [Cellulomonas fimi]
MRDAARPARTARPTGTLVELTYLDGLRDVLHDEVVDVLGPRRAPVDVPGRADALAVRVDGPLADVLRLRTAVAAYVALHFDVPRPRSLTSGDHLARIVDAVYASLRVAGSSTFRFEAAGSDSTVFRRLAELLHEATGLRHDPEDGELVVRVRRGSPRAGDGRGDGGRTGGGAGRAGHGGTGADADPGWDVLVRIGPRPLSARTWRVADYPGALNATIAAAMVRLAEVRPEERVLNLMCGSGTLLVERLLAGPAAAAVGVDTAPAALDAARANLAAARVRATVAAADALAPLPSALAGDERFDLVLVDPPWSGLHGAHAHAADLHAAVLRAARAAASPHARCVVVTHEVKVMERCLRDAAGLWSVRQTLRVFAKGHHPRIYVLDAV